MQDNSTMKDIWMINVDMEKHSLFCETRKIFLNEWTDEEESNPVVSLISQGQRRHFTILHETL